MNKQFTRREKLMLLLFALILLAAAYYWFIQVPVSTALTQIRYAQQDAEDSIILLEAQEQKLNEMERELEAIFADPGPVETPDYNNLEQLMVFLNTILGATENYSLNFQQNDNASADLVVRRVIHMSFTSPSYAAARQVIVNLHSSPYRCQLGSISLSPIQQSTPAPPPPQVEGVPATPEGGSVGLLSGAVQVSLSITFFEAL